MCGIAGFWAPDGTSATSSPLDSMVAALEHRGPDSAGHWRDAANGVELGHRRLAVVDLSPAGAQPMASACGRYQIVYNGEIYNHLALREGLERTGRAPSWRGHSDTETMLAMIVEHGPRGALERLDGMFALALWDREKRRLFIARDRLGEKPLYYGVCRGAFVFGSELDALRRYPGWDLRPDRLAVARFLRYSAVPAPQTIHAGISKLPAAHCLTIEHPAEPGRATPYWSVDEASERETPDVVPRADDALVDELERRLASSVEGCMLSDVPLGAFLSGGIDSSVVVALMQRVSARPVNTFTIGFEESSHDEAPHARAVARHLGTRHTEHYVSAREALDVVPELPHIWDEPFGDSSQIPTFLVSRLARRHVTVSLSGDGGDELFGGYRRYAKTMHIRERLARTPALARRLAVGAPLRSLRRVVDLGGTLAATDALNVRLDRLDALGELIGARDDDALYEAMTAQRSGLGTLVPGVDPAGVPLELDAPPGMPFTQRMLRRDTLAYLPDVILTKVDRAGMAVGLETRAPLLDHRLAGWAAGLPWDVKHADGVGKWPLVQLARRHLPADIIDRPKMGFGVPIGSWLRGPLKDWAEDLLAPRALADSDLLDARAVRRLWARHSSGRANCEHVLWNVLMLQAWWRVHGTSCRSARQSSRPTAA